MRVIFFFLWVYNESDEISRVVDVMQVVVQQRAELLPRGGSGIWDTDTFFTHLFTEPAVNLWRGLESKGWFQDRKGIQKNPRRRGISIDYSQLPRRE